VVREEFEGVELGDQRRSKRAKHIADRLAAFPDASLPDAMCDRAGTEALYRHLESEEVTLDALLAPHLPRTTERVRQVGLAFAIADTTAFKFTGEADREGLGPINRNDQGFLAHVTLAVSADGTRTPVGVLGVENWARPEKKTAKRPVSESSRWWRGMQAAQQRAGGTPLIHVADRESDIYELLAELTSSGQRFILRAAQDRTIVPTDGDERRLFDAVRCRAPSFTMEVPLSARQKKGNANQDKTFPSCVHRPPEGWRGRAVRAPDDPRHAPDRFQASSREDDLRRDQGRVPGAPRWRPHAAGGARALTATNRTARSR